MLSGKTYRTLALLGAFLVVAVQSLSAMSCSGHMSGNDESMHMACCNSSGSQMTSVCPIPGSMNGGVSCTCQVTPASETSRMAVVPATVSVVEATVSEVLTEQIPETSESGYTSEDPPDLNSDIPIFLRLRTLLN